ncbi:MAG: TPM domain-containing protein [Propionibacteriaceae bacterium]|jgi:uncharacterized protein|nr:TPM domain-containing protein [Propionibacteriaceae bacterium]
MKKIASIALALFFTLGFAASASADTGLNQGHQLTYVTDNAGLLTASDKSTLESQLAAVSAKYNFLSVIVTVKEKDSREAKLYAADFYDENTFPMAKTDGAILLLSMQDRDFGFATTGWGQDAFDQDSQDDLDDAMLPYLRQDQWAAGFEAYTRQLDTELGDYRQGKATGKVLIVIVAVVVGVGIGFLVSWRFKAQLKSVKPDEYARAYVKQGSFFLSASTDSFLYRNVSAVPIPQNEGKSSSGGFSSSSGGSFSGHSGKF